MEQNKALLVVSFGTSHHDTREKTIDQIEAYLGQSFPDRKVYRAWTSGMIIQKLRREGIETDTVPDALERMLRDRITDVLIQPTHLLNGIENDQMLRQAEAYRSRFQNLRIGAPLLTSDRDLQRVAEILTAQFPNLGEEEAVLLMGHGTEHDANAVYAALDYRFKDMGRDRFYMATVEGYPALEQALRQMKANQRLQKVYLVPFMIVAGDHAKHDMAGPKPDSWKRMVADAGYEPCCLLRGLGEMPEVRQLLAEHAGQAEARQSAPFRGKLTGVGVGPGDPELLTYKAMKHIQNCDLLVLPDSDRGNCVAYQIVEKAWAGVRNKPVLQVAMPMTHDKARMAESHLAAARAVERHLDQGKQVVFLTLGDPSVYSTYFYLHRQITADGYEAEMVPGVPSFCAAAAQLGRSLGMGTEMIHIIPSWHGVEQGLDLPGVKVLMKAGSQMGRVKQALLDRGMEAAMVENCGMDGQRCFRSTAEIPEDAGYFSLLLVREEGGAR